MEGLVTVFSGKIEAKEGIPEEELEKLTPRSASWLWSGIFWRRPPVDDRRAEACANRAGARNFVCRAAMRIGVPAQTPAAIAIAPFSQVTRHDADDQGGFHALAEHDEERDQHKLPLQCPSRPVVLVAPRRDCKSVAIE